MSPLRTLLTVLAFATAPWVQAQYYISHTDTGSSAANGSSSPLPAGSAATPLSAANASYTYGREDLLTDLSHQLAEHYRVTGDLQVELLRAWASPAATSQPITAQLLEAPANLNSTLLVRFRLQSGNQSLGDYSQLVRVQLMRDVWFVRSPIERGANFDPSQLDTRRVDTIRERDALAVSDATADLTFARAIPAGRMIGWRDVSRRALVRKGDVIEVSAADGILSITMKALAMENGSAGETVRVRNLESKKEFSAQVVAESRAQVRF